MVELGASKSSGEGSNPSSGANINTSVNLLFFTKFKRRGSMKLKNTNAHVLYRYRRAAIERYVSKDNTWIVTNLSVDNKLFCIKTI